MTRDRAAPPLGAHLEDEGVRFGAYVTETDRCAVCIFDPVGQPTANYPLLDTGEGYFERLVPGLKEGALYKFLVGDRELPDPYARFLPEGVHGPARVVSRGYPFANPGVAVPLDEQVIYELHVGTFTPEGTYEGARQRLGYLADLGVRSVELMPVAAFAGSRGWGYDGVAHYAPFAGYGTPDALRRFVDEAHGLGLSVILDVVYNHFGPAGNYLSAYSRGYFLDPAAHRDTPWGHGPNFASPAMRRYVVENALYWLAEFRFDGLRLDAVHAIHDASATHVVRELADRAHGQGKALLFAEDERNDGAAVRDLGCDAVWADDFHHQVRVTLTGEKDGYYGSYAPGATGIADAINEGWIYRGQLYPATGRPRGKPAALLPAESLVYCIQNHDQVGNRAFGDRLSSSVPLAAYRAASMLLLFLPMTPLLFMGQEWAARSPFLFFTDHEGPLGEAVTRGRREEFKTFAAFSDPSLRERLPDPQAIETFAASTLRWAEQGEAEHTQVLDLYRRLLALRRSDPVLRRASRAGLRAEAKGEVLVVRRTHDAGVRVLVVNFGVDTVSLDDLALPERDLRTLLSSEAEATGKHLLPHAAVLLGAPGDR